MEKKENKASNKEGKRKQEEKEMDEEEISVRMKQILQVKNKSNVVLKGRVRKQGESLKEQAHLKIKLV